MATLGNVADIYLKKTTGFEQSVVEYFRLRLSPTFRRFNNPESKHLLFITILLGL
jgi:hypothetical protein